MARWLTLDAAYPAAFNALPHANHEEWFEKGCFGTSDFLDVALRTKGHQATTLVQNFFTGNDIVAAAYDFEPDVVLCREAGRWPGMMLKTAFPGAKIICTCSHRVEDAALNGFDAVFSSFLWMHDYCHSIGVRCEYLPLCFGRPVLRRIGDEPIERDIPVAFVGGIGTRIWDKGTRDLAMIAENIPDFRWWGYVCGSLSDLPIALQKVYVGPAWGADYFRLLHRIKVLVNRHGEIAKGHGNNTRQWEALGCGCYLLTDNSSEVEFCSIYSDGENATNKIRQLLDNWEATEEIAKNGQRWVLANGCYENRVDAMLKVVESL